MGQEFEWIDLIKKKMGPNSRRVLHGIGDDAAVVESPLEKMLASVDCQVEGVHFDLKYVEPAELGYRAVAVNLSDLAAMGGEPLYILLSLGLSSKVDNKFMEGLVDGMKPLLREFEVDLIGGNISRSPNALFVDITVLGEAPQNFVLRSGARVGDLIVVSGPLGLAAAGLGCFKKLGRDAKELFPEVTEKYLSPIPRLRESQALLETGGVTSMLDISDGLSSDLGHLCKESKVGALLDFGRIAPTDLVRKAASFFGGDPKDLVLNGGEDYELLFTLDPDRLEEAKTAMKLMGGQFEIIGEIKELEFGVQISDGKGVSPLQAKGWVH